MKRSFNDATDQLPPWMSTEIGADDDFFDLSVAQFLPTSPRPVSNGAHASLPPPASRSSAAPPAVDVRPAANVGRDVDQKSGYSAYSTSTDATPPPRPTPPTLSSSDTAARREKHEVGAVSGEDKEALYHCDCGVGELDVDALIEFIRAHPKMVAVTSEDGSPLLIRTIARQVIGDMRRHRHAPTCAAVPKVPAGLESALAGGSDADGDAGTAAAATAAAAATPFSMSETERKALRVLLNRSAAERSRLRKKARFETLSATLAEKASLIESLQEKVRSLNGIVSHLQLLLKLGNVAYHPVLSEAGRDILARDRDVDRLSRTVGQGTARPEGLPNGRPHLSGLMDEATQAWDRAAHAA